MFRNLAASIEAPTLPEGFSVRPLVESKIDARVAAVKAIWSGNSVTPEKYRDVMGLPSYRPELDLVAVASEGALAAFCTVWLDETNGVGNFEPVGTHPDYRCRGLGLAVVLEGMRRMKSLGAHTACVFCHVDSQAALRLYERCGFLTRRRDYGYSRRL
jgi:ribosomal protein S18 acetylase RimI-like enzyme